MTSNSRANIEGQRARCKWSHEATERLLVAAKKTLADEIAKHEFRISCVKWEPPEVLPYTDDLETYACIDMEPDSDSTMLVFGVAWSKGGAEPELNGQLVHWIIRDYPEPKQIAAFKPVDPMNFDKLLSVVRNWTASAIRYDPEKEHEGGQQKEVPRRKTRSGGCAILVLTIGTALGGLAWAVHLFT
jgi:hypothetical protein